MSLDKQDVSSIIENLQMVTLSSGYRVSDFDAEIDDYKLFLCQDALRLQNCNVSKTHLLIHKENADIVAYMSLVSDSLRLSENEKCGAGLGNECFNSFPALKIGKLAVNKSYKERYKGIGSFMVELARGIMNDVNEVGVACKFLTVDADIELNPTVNMFYEKLGFLNNESCRSRTKSISMRLDVYAVPVALENTGTNG